MSAKTMATGPAGSQPPDRAMAEEPVGRDLAIPAIGLMPWGTHLCQFYATKQDLLDVLVPYYRAGLQNNEACFWLVCEPLKVEEATEALAAEVDDLEQRMAAKQMKVAPYTSWYGEGGKFDRDGMLTSVISHVADAVAHGWAGTRASGDMMWLPDEDWDAFMEYESGLNSVMPNRRTVGVCTYSLRRFGGEQMVDVLMEHQYGLVKHGDWTLIEPSERKKATAAVERMNRALGERTAELQAALADLRGFSRWVSHDLRAPLRSISTFGDMLAQESEGRLTRSEAHLLDRIRGNAAWMDQLITDILSYSMAQRTEMRAGLLDMESLARLVCADLADTAERQGVKLRVDVLPPAYGDAAMVRQVLTNLVSNGIKFTQGTSDACVRVGFAAVADGIAYQVSDNGVGFDMAFADKLFGAFERLHSNAEFEGTGLGLAIVKEVITRHGGRVWAEGAPREGATFSFTLPNASAAGRP